MTRSQIAGWLKASSRIHIGRKGNEISVEIGWIWIALFVLWWLP